MSPIYQYKTTEKGCDYCRDGFEIMQSMKDKSLSRCPKCHGPIRKTPASVSGDVPTFSNSNLCDKGFTNLVKRGDS